MDLTNAAVARPECPSCGSGEVSIVVWGMPTPEIIATAAETGDIDFGSCCITPDSPDFCCRVCDTVW
jgi:hypothetical protein